MLVSHLSAVRRISLALLLSMLLMLLCGASRTVPSAEAAPTAAVSGVVLVVRESEHNSRTPKTLPADCPLGKRVIGGGGGAIEFIDVDDPGGANPALTELRPLSVDDGVTTRDSYIVSAAETPPGTTNDWWITAYAVCADPLPGLNIISASTTLSSKAIQTTPVSCGGGVVIGTGARVSARTGNVVLQVARPSHPGDKAYAQAHEVAGGFIGHWSVTAYAVCVPTKPAGYQVVFAESNERLSEARKHGFAYCPSGKRLLSSGAAITNIAPGHVSLQGIIPLRNNVSPYKWGTWARAVENTPTNLNWDFIVATAVCAY